MKARIFAGVSIALWSVFCDGCASKWQEEKEMAAARQAAGAEPAGDPSSCPKVSLGTLVLDACCTADNQCGGDGTKVGYGCSSLADPMFRSFITNPPEPRKCAPAALGSGAPTGSAVAGSGAASPTAASPIAAGVVRAGSAAGSAAPPSSGMSPSVPSSGSAGSSPFGGDASKCPSFMAFGMMVHPCCTPANHCGADGTAMGFGCTDLGDAMFRMIAGDGVPSPLTCDGMPL